MTKEALVAHMIEYCIDNQEDFASFIAEEDGESPDRLRVLIYGLKDDLGD